MSLELGNTIDRLQQYSDASFFILSVYLPIYVDGNSLVQRYRELIKRTFDKREQKRLAQDIDYMDGFLQQQHNFKDNKGLALFSGGNKLWEVIETRGELPESIQVAHSPFLDPIYKELSDFQRYLVVVADKEKAKFFTIRLGHVEDQQEVFDDSAPRNIKGQGWAQRRIENHIQDHVYKHFKLIGERVNDFVRGKYINGVIVGGHKATIHDLEKYLPQNLQKKVVGEFVAELNVNINQIVEESKKVIEKVNKHMDFNKYDQHYDLHV